MNCPFCQSDTDYSNIGNHWRQSCGYPEPDHLSEVFDGLLMGDGCLKRSSNSESRVGNQCLEIISINKEYVDYLYDKYNPYFSEPTVRRTAKEAALNAKDSEYITTSEGSTFRDQYRIVTKAIPFFNRYDKWAKSGEKRWPKDIELNSTQLRYLYVGDGGLSWNKDSNSVRAQITSTNEPDMLEKISDKFNSMNIDCSVFDGRVMFKPTSTKSFLDFIGSKPVPGFEYKWEINNLDRYETLHRNVYNVKANTYTM